MVTGFWIQRVQAREKIRFDNIADAKAALEKAGFVCANNTKSGRVSAVFLGILVSKVELPWEERSRVFRTGLDGPGWKGKIYIDAPYASFVISKNSKIWGNVCVEGDHELIAEVEKRLAEID